MVKVHYLFLVLCMIYFEVIKLYFIKLTLHYARCDLELVSLVEVVMGLNL